MEDDSPNLWLALPLGLSESRLVASGVKPNCSDLVFLGGESHSRGIQNEDHIMATDWLGRTHNRFRPRDRGCSVGYFHPYLFWLPPFYSFPSP